MPNQRLTLALRQVDDETVTHKGGVVANTCNERFVRCQPPRNRVNTSHRDGDCCSRWNAINGCGLRRVVSQRESAERQRDRHDHTQSHLSRKAGDEKSADDQQNTDDEKRHETAS